MHSIFPYTSVGQEVRTPGQVAFNAAVQRTQALQRQVDAAANQLNALQAELRQREDGGIFGNLGGDPATLPLRDAIRNRTEEFRGLAAQLAAAQQEQARLRSGLPIRTTGGRPGTTPTPFPIGGGGPITEPGSAPAAAPNYLVPALVVGAALLAGGYLLSQRR